MPRQFPLVAAVESETTAQWLFHDARVLTAAQVQVQYAIECVSEGRCSTKLSELEKGDVDRGRIVQVKYSQVMWHVPGNMFIYNRYNAVAARSVRSRTAAKFILSLVDLDVICETSSLKHTTLYTVYSISWCRRRHYTIFY